MNLQSKLKMFNHCGVLGSNLCLFWQKKFGSTKTFVSASGLFSLTKQWIRYRNRFESWRNFLCSMLMCTSKNLHLKIKDCFSNKYFSLPVTIFFSLLRHEIKFLFQKEFWSGNHSMIMFAFVGQTEKYINNTHFHWLISCAAIAVILIAHHNIYRNYSFYYVADVTFVNYVFVIAGKSLLWAYFVINVLYLSTLSVFKSDQLSSAL